MDTVVHGGSIVIDPLTLSSGATCQIDTKLSSTSLFMDKYEGWYTLVGSRINTYRTEITTFILNKTNVFS